MFDTDTCGRAVRATLSSHPPTCSLLTVVTLLTDFNPENGSTAYVPGSHIHPSYPHNKEEFFKRAIQVDK